MCAGILDALGCREIVIQGQTLQMPMYPNTTATGSEPHFESQAAGDLQIVDYARPNRLKKIELPNSRVSLRSNLFAIDDHTFHLFKVRVKVEISARTPDAINPPIEAKLAAMSGEKLLP